MELKLCFPADNPPLAVIVAGKIGGLSLSADSSLPSGSPPTLLLPNGYDLFVYLFVTIHFCWIVGFNLIETMICAELFNCMCLQCRMKLQGLYVLLRYMGRAGKIPKFYDRDAFESSQVFFFVLKKNRVIALAFFWLYKSEYLCVLSLSRLMNGWSMLLFSLLALSLKEHADMLMGIYSNIPFWLVMICQLPI